MAEKKEPLKFEKPTSTKQFGFELIIPAKQHLGLPTVYKIVFGTKYFIWKGKSLQQSCEIMAKSISAGLSKINKGVPLEDTNYLYYVLKHIKSSRCTSGKVDVLYNDFYDEFGAIDGLKVLKCEQLELDAADGDLLNLNNNEQSYIPDNNIWITQPMKNKFLKWYKERKKK